MNDIDGFVVDRLLRMVVIGCCCCFLMWAFEKQEKDSLLFDQPIKIKYSSNSTVSHSTESCAIHNLPLKHKPFMAVHPLKIV